MCLFCQVNNLMLLHVWDLLSQPEQCNHSTLIPFVSYVQLLFPAFALAPVMWSCNLWEGLGHGGQVPQSLLCAQGLCGQGLSRAGWGGFSLVLPQLPELQLLLPPPQSHRPALATPLLLPISISKSQWRSN